MTTYVAQVTPIKRWIMLIVKPFCALDLTLNVVSFVEVANVPSVDSASIVFKLGVGIPERIASLIFFER